MRRPAVALALVCVVLAATAGRADTALTPTHRITGVRPPAQDSNGRSELHTGGARNVTANGSVVVFHSHASNLVSGDTNGRADIFSWTRSTGAVVRLTSGNDSSLWPSISNNLRVAFDSMASNLIAGDTNNARDVFVRDPGGAITRVSVASDGAESNEPPWSTSASGSSISPDGRYVAFTSAASNLVPGDTNNVQDVFLRDTCFGVAGACTPTTTLVSAGPGGVPGNNRSATPSVSSNGLFVAFQSFASNLMTCVAGQPVTCDTNNQADIFVRHMLTGTVYRASWPTAAGGPQTVTESSNPQISANGRSVVFESLDEGLDPSDVANNTGESDVFVRDLCVGFGCEPSTVRVSGVAPAPQARSGEPVEPLYAHFPSVSDDGRYVAYVAGKPLPGDTAQHPYVWDRNRARSFRVPAGPVTPKSLYGVTGPALPFPPFASGAYPSIAGNGSALVFASDDPRIDPLDRNSFTDVFIHTFACAGADCVLA